MSYEVINRITVKKDGVYISSYSNNCSHVFRSSRISLLSDVYKEKGQKALDVEVIRMLCEYAITKGNHKSVERYRKAMHSPQATLLQQERRDKASRYDEYLVRDYSFRGFPKHFGNVRGVDLEVLLARWIHEYFNMNLSQNDLISKSNADIERDLREGQFDLYFETFKKELLKENDSKSEKAIEICTITSKLNNLFIRQTDNKYYEQLADLLDNVI